MIKILFVSANPKEKSLLNLDLEYSRIESVLRSSLYRDEFQLKPLLATTYNKFREELIDWKPSFIHFCGHGMGKEGLVFVNDNGEKDLVNSQALADLFRICQDENGNIACITFNTCYGEFQSKDIREYIKYSIGMNQEIKDSHAIVFAEAFYDAIFSKTTIETAFELGKNSILKALGINSNNRATFDPADDDYIVVSKNIPDYEIPRLIINENLENLYIKSASENSERKFVEKLPNKVSLEMMRIPKGSFQMGSYKNKEEQPVHEVTIQPFFMSKYLITQKQWKTVATLPQVKCKLNPEPSRFTGDSLPVERISWYDAQEFCARLSRRSSREYRLPSEAEWEYACRAGTTTSFHFGETLTSNKVNCNDKLINIYEMDEHKQETTPVGSFPANTFGLYDMHGNVYEWCEDCWYPNYEEADNSRKARQQDDTSSVGLSLRVLRGGAWVCQPKNCRCAFRNYVEPNDRYSIIGFRIVCNLAT